SPGWRRRARNSVRRPRRRNTYTSIRAASNLGTAAQDRRRGRQVANVGAAPRSLGAASDHPPRIPCARLDRRIILTDSGAHAALRHVPAIALRSIAPRIATGALDSPSPRADSQDSRRRALRSPQSAENAHATISARWLPTPAPVEECFMKSYPLAHV